MKTMLSSRFLLAACWGAALLTACPGDDAVLETEDTGTSTSTGEPPATTLPMSDTDSSTTMGVADTTMTPDDTTTSGDPDTTGSSSGEGSSSSGEGSSSSGEGSSSSGEGSSSSGESSSSGGQMNMEGFAECSMGDALCLPDEGCLVDDPAAPNFTVCTDLDCVDASECPEAPPGGTAPVACDDLTGDAINDCFLDCSAGQACPTGMDCFGGFLCAWPTDPPAPQGYAECEDAMGCLPEETCVVDDPAAPTITVCTDLDCAAPADCPSAPPGGTAPITCDDITGDAIGDCFLDCSAGQACPTGMDCFGGLLCAWSVAPAVPQGFGECADGTACLPGESCLVDNPAAPTIGVCTDLDCVTPVDCPTAPPGGTAPVTCADLSGDAIGDCFLDCSAGQACPTGMDCFSNFVCAWPA